MKKRIIALLLTLAMLLSVLPGAVLAADADVCVVENAATAAINEGIQLVSLEDNPIYFQLLGLDENATSIQFLDDNFQTLMENGEVYVTDVYGMMQWDYDSDQPDDGIIAILRYIEPLTAAECQAVLADYCAYYADDTSDIESTLTEAFASVDGEANVYCMNLLQYSEENDTYCELFYCFVVGMDVTPKPKTYTISASGDARVSFTLNETASADGAASASYSETDDTIGAGVTVDAALTNITCTDASSEISRWTAAYQGQKQTQTGAGTLTFGSDADALTLEFTEDSITIRGLLKGNLTLTPQVALLPVKIGTADELLAFADLVNRGTLDRSAVLTDDIDLTGKEWTPIGNAYNKLYTGTFDGQNHTISGLTSYTTSGSYHGLFGIIGSGAVIQNLTVEGSLTTSKTCGGIVATAKFDKADGTITIKNCTNAVEIHTTTIRAGGVLGSMTSSSYAGTLRLEGCKNTAAITSSSKTAGGIVAELGKLPANSAIILTDCTNAGAVTSGDSAGGLLATADTQSGPAALTIERCANTAPVQGAKDAGGLVGNASVSTASITDCTNSGKVTGVSSSGGLAGALNANKGTLTISDCQNSGNIFGKARVGGVVGMITYGSDNATVTRIERSGNLGTISATGEAVGGLLAYLSSSSRTTVTAAVEQCYNLGDVRTDDDPAGGLIGQVNSYCATVADSYSTGSVSSTGNAGGLVGTFGYYQAAATTKITSSYAAPASLSGADDTTGALVGATQYAAYENCYFAAAEGSRAIGKLSYKPATQDISAADDTLLTKLGSAFTADSGSLNRGYPVLSFQQPGEGVTVTALLVDASEAAEVLFAPNRFALNTNGLRFTAVYSDGTRRPIPASAVTFDTTGVNAAQLGTYDVTARYGGAEATFQVTISGDVPAVILPAEATGDYAGMAGYYKIETAPQLRWFTDRANNVDTTASAVLANDIDVSALCGETLGSWPSLGAQSAYRGTLNGGGHSIQNLYWNATGNNQYTGLVATLAGTVKNLTVTGTLQSSALGTSYAGGIAAYADQNVRIENCTNRVAITTTGSVISGGIVGGTSNAYVKDCTNQGSITANTAGGIIGKILKTESQKSAEPTLQSCRNEAAVTSANALAGGIVADAGGTVLQITGCVNTGAVLVDASSGNNLYAGGIVAKSSVSSNRGGNLLLTSCRNEGTVTLNSTVSSSRNYAYAGGVVGSLESTMNVTIQSCTNSGKVTLEKASTQCSYVGGIVGRYDYQPFLLMIDCANTADLSGYGSVGGLMGYLRGSTYSDKDDADKLLKNNGPYILRCASTGSIAVKAIAGETNQYAGGLIGEVGFDGIRVDDSYHTGTVATAGQYAGGLFGSLPKTGGKTYMVLTGCYTSGTVTTSDANGAAGQIVGLVPDGIAATVENVYYEQQTGTNAIGAGEADLAFTEMQAGQAITRAGLGFVAENGGTAVLPWQLGLTQEALNGATALTVDSAQAETLVYPFNCAIADVLDTNGILATATIGGKSYQIGHKLLTADVSKVNAAVTGTYPVTLALGAAQGSYQIQIDTIQYTIGFAATDKASGADIAASVTLKNAENETVAPKAGSTYLLYPGTYTYTVSMADYRTQTGTLEVAINDTDRTVTVQLDHTYDVTFDLRNEAGNKIRGASITVKDAAGSVQPTDDGYTFALPSGTYTYSVKAEGYTSVPATEFTVDAQAQQIRVDMVIWDSKVYFSLWGDDAHGDAGSHRVYRDMTEWIAMHEVPIEEGWTARELIVSVLEANHYTVHFKDNTRTYISGITTPEGMYLGEFTNGTFSGWIYMVNEGYTNVGVAARPISDGEVVTLYYVDDYRAEGSILLTEPTKRVYYAEDRCTELDTTGLKVQFQVNPMDGGSGKLSDVTKNVRLYTLGGGAFDGRQVGWQRIFVAYGGYTGSFMVEVRNMDADQLQQALADSIAQAEQLSEQNYDSTTWAALAPALKNAKAAAAKPGVTEEELRAALNSLKDAQEALERLANQVSAQIEQLGDITKDSGDAITAARAAYDALPEDQKTLVTNYQTLLDAESAYDRLWADDAKQALDAIPAPLTPENIDEAETALDAARAAYDALTDSQKALVNAEADMANVLTQTGEAIAALRQDMAAAAAVEQQIDAIGTVTKDSGEAIAAARAAYDALTDAQKALVSNDNVLRDAEKKLHNITTGTSKVQQPAKDARADAPEADSSRFDDVQPGDWFAASVDYVSKNGLMTGTSQTAFSPNASTTRGMIVTIFARMSGVKTSGTPWYAAGRTWAMENGISDGTNMLAPITREQLATMLFRYAAANGMQAVTLEENLSSFSDADQISSWAVAAMNWAVGQELIAGTNGRLAPQQTATRAQVAAILTRYLEQNAK